MATNPVVSDTRLPIRKMTKGKVSDRQRIKTTLTVVKKMANEIEVKSPRPPSFETLPEHLRKYKHPNWQPGQSGNPLGLAHPNAVAKRNERLITSAYRKTAGMIHEDTGLTMADLLALAMFYKGMEGDVGAAREIREATEGKLLSDASPGELEGSRIAIIDKLKTKLLGFERSVTQTVTVTERIKLPVRQLTALTTTQE